MAVLEYIAYTPRRPYVHDGQVVWEKTKAKAISRLPQICWDDGSTWSEANLWALEAATGGHTSIKTVTRSMAHLLYYAKWLEAESIGWWEFPARERDRCLTRFRGALIKSREAGDIAPSTITQRMSTLVRFYRWLQSTGLLSPESPMWSERKIGITLTDGFGFEHTLRVTSTDLAIPNRKVAGRFLLEDGLLPVTLDGMRQILELASTNASEELAWQLRLGFHSGLRLGSITDIKVDTLLNASVDPVMGWHRIEVGPAANPPVATKFGVNGLVPIPTELLNGLCQYSASTRRLKRQAKAPPEHRGLLFLTRQGNPYGGDTSRAVNVEMHRLRQAGKAVNMDVMHGFFFHRSRATFGTELMRVALRCLPLDEAVELVREAMLHRNTETTLRYVRFINQTKAMAAAADAFTEAFLGLAQAYGTRNA